MKKPVFVFFALAMFGLFALAQTPVLYKPPVFLDMGRKEKVMATRPVVEAMIAAHAAKYHFPGYAYGIMVDGQLVYSGANGFANIEKGVAANGKTMFRIASMSKSFTAMAIVKLRDEGKLKLDDPAYLYIPELKGQALTGDAAPITIRNLLTHSAGFPEDNPWGDRQLADTEKELIDLVKKGISFSNPTAQNYEYSNLAFCMLGIIIHKVSGMYYADYICKAIWEPLKMQAGWDYAQVGMAQAAQGYRWQDSRWQQETPLGDGICGAMGGMITSVESFAKYMALHLDAWPARNDMEAGPVKRSSIREMQQPWTFNNLNTGYTLPNGRTCGMATGYGYGLAVVNDCEGKKHVGHSGGLPGFGSNWRILPDYGVGVVMLANVTYAPTAILNIALLDTIVRLAGLQPRQLPPSAILTQRRNEIVKLLPDFTDARKSGIFADNFFDDYLLDSLKKQARDIIGAAGPLKQVKEVVPENQLRGSFTLDCESGRVWVYFTLTPEAVPLIQEFRIRLVK